MARVQFKSPVKFVLVTLLVLAVAACGGGGGSGPDPAPTPAVLEAKDLAGIYRGTITSGTQSTQVQFLVDDKRNAYVLTANWDQGLLSAPAMTFATTSSAVLVLSGPLWGASMSDMTIALPNAATTATFTGSFTRSGRITGTGSLIGVGQSAGASAVLDLTLDSATTHAAAGAAVVKGNWSDGVSVIGVDDTGAISGQIALAGVTQAVSGTVTQISGLNLYNVSIQLGGQTMTGVGYVQTDSTNKRYLSFSLGNSTVAAFFALAAS